MGLYLFHNQSIVVSGILHLYAFSLPLPYQLLCRAFVMERRWIVGNAYRVWARMDDSDV